MGKKQKNKEQSKKTATKSPKKKETK